jgi:acyl carrier protein
MTTADLERAVLVFVNETLLRDRPKVTAADRLFEEGHLDSLRVLELIRFIEDSTGRRVPDRSIRLATFRSVRAIARAFGDETAGVAQADEDAGPTYEYHTTPERFASPIAELRAGGELLESDGLYRLAGSAAELADFFDATFARWGQELGADDVVAPELIPMATLERAGFLAEFPHLLVKATGEHADAAYAPAACYHRYAGLAGASLERALVLGVCGNCRRAETDAAPLERAIRFTMRETVTVGRRQDVERTQHRLLRRVDRFVTMLSLDGGISPASDPFFIRDSGQALMQRAGALKQELRLSLDNGRRVAVASFNRHHDYFGRRFSITMQGAQGEQGAPAHSGCVAFGIERWVLAFLTQHGTDQRRWPVPVRDALELRRAHAPR